MSGILNVMLAGGGAAWTPTSLGSALIAWYKADTGVYKDAGSTLAANNENAAQWNDQSGNSRHLSTTGVNAPLFKTAGLNSRQTVQFTSGQGNLLTKTSFPLGTAGIASCFAVMSVTVSSNNFARIIGYAAPTQTETGANSCGFFLCHANTTTLGSYQSGFLSDMTIVNGTNYRLGSIFDGSNSTVYLNNAAQTPAAASFSFTTNGTLAVGEDSNASADYDGNLSELIITNTALSSGDRASLDAYLAARWGL